MLKKFSLFLGAAALAVFIVAPVKADTVSICYSTSATTCGAGQQVDSSSGAAAYTSSSVSGFSMINIAASGTPPQPEPYLNLNTLDVTSSGAGTLAIEATETGLTSLSSPFPFKNFFSSVLSSAGSTITFDNYISSSNTAYATTTLIGSQTWNGGPNSFASNSSFNGTVTTPFSETELIYITFNGGGESVQGNDLITGSVPEPVSMGLMGAGLFGLGIFGYRRRKSA